MKDKKIKWLTSIGILTVVLLQIVWLSNTYILIQKDIIEDSNSLLSDAIQRELYHRLSTLESKIPEGTVFGTGEIEDSGEKTSDIPIMNEAFIKLGSHISFIAIDSIYTNLLKENNIHTKIIINIITDKDSIIESTYPQRQPLWGIIKTNPVPIRTDGSENIQAIILNPYWSTLQKMTLLLIATAVMMAFVGYCIVCQIRIIIRQRKIAEMKETFSYAMIHDMKTPIGSLQLGAHILRRLKPEDTEKRNKYLTLMEEESEHLYLLANRVLTLAKLEKDCLQLNKEVIFIQPIIKDLTDMFTAKSTKQISFTTHIEAEAVYADKEYFKEIIANLIDNAIKYSKESVSIYISSKEKEEYIQISVRDNGLGIGTKDIEKIFEKFERSRNTIKRQRKGGPAGFGLGLAYVKQMTEAHDGKVSIKSKEGEYSEFIINLPKLTEEL